MVNMSEIQKFITNEALMRIAMREAGNNEPAPPMIAKGIREMIIHGSLESLGGTRIVKKDPIDAETASKQWYRCQDLVLDPPNELPHLPGEIICEIGAVLDDEGLLNLRLVNKKFRYAVAPHFGKHLVVKRAIFPTFSSIVSFIALLIADPIAAMYVREVTLVREGLRMHEHGCEWAWERMMDAEGVRPTKKDKKLIEWASDEHVKELTTHGAFVNGGGYRTMLGAIFSSLPKIKIINTRKLKVGEHVPGWKGPDAIKNLSFYRQGLPTNEIWYDGWQYDTKHLRVTVWVDEFGELDGEDDIGPQANFFDDVIAAKTLAIPEALIVELD